ncbi:MAG: hypothetical protein QXO69_01550 [archaeon]
MIVSQYPHFYEDKDGKKHRNMLQVEVDEPKMSGAFPKDGSVMIRIQDETSQKAFKMTPQETLQLGTELKEIAKEQLKIKRDMWKGKSK